MKNKSKLTVMSHKNNEYFNVVVMNFINSSIYVQKKINQLLRYYSLFDFIRVYVDNIVVFNQILKKHIEYLTAIFSFFVRFRIVLKSIKIYIDFLFITLFKQHVIIFDFITISKKFEIIFRFRFSHIFKNLKHYLKLTE